PDPHEPARRGPGPDGLPVHRRRGPGGPGRRAEEAGRRPGLRARPGPARGRGRARGRLHRRRARDGAARGDHRGDGHQAATGLRAAAQRDLRAAHLSAAVRVDGAAGPGLEPVPAALPARPPGRAGLSRTALWGGVLSLTALEGLLALSWRGRPGRVLPRYGREVPPGRRPGTHSGSSSGRTEKRALTMGYGVIGNTTVSGTVILGSSPGTPALTASA